MSKSLENFARSEDGAITIDWVVLAAAVVAMSIASADILSGGIGTLTSNLEEQLRLQQISDAFVQFAPNHFDALYEATEFTEDEAELYFDGANEFTNGELLTLLDTYIRALGAGTTPTAEEYAVASAVASVAYQRNIVADEVVEQYFAFGMDQEIIDPGINDNSAGRIFADHSDLLGTGPEPAQFGGVTY